MNKVSNFRCLLAFVILFLPDSIPAQEVKIDTSAYLPFFYDGALEYNLMVAAEKGYEKEVERLILLGADIEAESPEGATPLIYAVSNNRLNTVKVLLKYNADPNKVTVFHQTPLLISIKTQNLILIDGLRKAGPEANYQFLEIAEALIRAGADMNYQDNSGVTALNYASVYGLFYFVDLLIYYGADIDKKANDGTSPLMSAVWSGYADIADLLIRKGANIEARDNTGFTPFLIAAQNGDTLLLSRLLRNGVDLYEKNVYGWNALCLAIKSDQQVAVEFLIRKGEKWNDPGNEAADPYSVAVKYGRKNIVEFLDKNNFHAEHRFSIDQMAISLSSKFTIHDVYTGLDFGFKEPLTSMGFRAGVDTKLWYTKVLAKEDDNLYYQYKDKSSIVYAGLFKEFPLTKNLFKSNKSIYASLTLGYTFGNKFTGTNIVPENKYKLIPEIGFKWSKKNFIIFSGLEFMSAEFYRIGPFWGRIGFSYNFFFDNMRAPGKIIKWY